MERGIGDKFQDETKYKRRNMDFSSLDWNNKPPLYKKYLEVKRTPLPKDISINTLSLTEVLKKRKSIRDFSHDPITMNELSFLLWSASGIQRIENDHMFRTAPSAGALYPIENYLVVNDVEKLERGIYHYSIEDHMLEEMKLGDFRQASAQASLGQDICGKAPLMIVWSAIFERSKWKYKQRAYRYIYLDVGHMAENLALAATSMGMGSCQIGAFYDEEMNDLFDLDGEKESIVYSSIVGHIKK